MAEVERTYRGKEDVVEEQVVQELGREEEVFEVWRESREAGGENRADPFPRRGSQT